MGLLYWLVFVLLGNLDGVSCSPPIPLSVCLCLGALLFALKIRAARLATLL